MRPEDYDVDLEPRCAQLRLLKQTLRSLREEKDLAESIKEANLRSAKRGNLPEEAKHIEERYSQDLARIETTVRRTEMQIQTIQEENPCRLPEKEG